MNGQAEEDNVRKRLPGDVENAVIELYSIPGTTIQEVAKVVGAVYDINKNDIKGVVTLALKKGLRRAGRGCVKKHSKKMIRRPVSRSRKKCDNRKSNLRHMMMAYRRRNSKPRNRRECQPKRKIVCRSDSRKHRMKKAPKKTSRSKRRSSRMCRPSLKMRSSSRRRSNSKRRHSSSKKRHSSSKRRYCSSKDRRSSSKKRHSSSKKRHSSSKKRHSSSKKRHSSSKRRYCSSKDRRSSSKKRHSSSRKKRSESKTKRPPCRTAHKKRKDTTDPLVLPDHPSC